MEQKEIDRAQDESQKQRGTPFKQMTPAQKVKFIFKLTLCIMTFGMAFPNVMHD